MSNDTDFEAALERHLRKCELEYRAKHGGMAQQVDWLAPYCNTLKEIADTLRKLGFKIKRIMNDADATGGPMRWVETTSGIIVYENDKFCRGIVGKAAR